MLNSKFYTSTENSQNSFISSIGTIGKDGILIYYNKNMEYIKFENIINVRLLKKRSLLINNLFLLLAVFFIAINYFFELSIIELTINIFILLISLILYFKFNIESTFLVIVTKNSLNIKIKLKREQISDAKLFCIEIVDILRKKNAIN